MKKNKILFTLIGTIVACITSSPPTMHAATTIDKYGDLVFELPADALSESDISNNEIHYTTFYTYNQNNDISSSTLYSYGHDDNHVCDIIYFYDIQGRLIKETTYYDPSSYTVYEYIYDDHGRLIAEGSSFIFNNSHPLETYQYDNNSVTFDSYVYHYNDIEQLLSRERLGFLYKLEFRYDENGKLLQIGTCSQQGFTGHVYTY